MFGLHAWLPWASNALPVVADVCCLAIATHLLARLANAASDP